MLHKNKIAKAIQYSLLCGSMVFAQASWAQEAQQQDSQADEEEVEKVEVTGSRIKRSELEGPQALTIITSEDMAARGEVTVFDALKNLSQNSTFQYEGPESQLFTPDVQTINLRGIGVGNTLVLINGRRAANYPAAYQSSTSVFNYGSIPAAAVERIEVLSTGASAIYGSDAVAGVVNIILKKDVEDTTVDVMLGATTETYDAKYTKRFQLVTGKTFENGNLTAVVQYQKRDPIQGKDLPKFDNEIEDFPYGQGILDRVIVNLNQWDVLNGRGDGGYVNPGEEACDALGNGTEHAYRPGRGYYCGRNGIQESNFRNENEQYSIFVDGNYRLGSGVELFGNVSYFNSEGRSNNDIIYIFEDIIDYDTIVDTGFGFAYYDWFLAQRGFTEEELGISLDQTFDNQSLTMTFGAMGQVFDDHDWEVAFVNSKYKLQSSRPWWKSEAVIDTFLGSFEGFGFFGDPWWTGEGSFGLKDNLFAPVNDSVRDALGYQTYGNETSSTSLQFLLSGDLFMLDAGPVSYAFVAEYEKQKMELIPDERISQPPPLPGLTGSGWWKLTGYRGKGERTRSALGMEVRVPLLETLTANLAARVDKYDNTSSSIGTRTTPSISLEYRPADSVLVRAGYSGSFRAPDMNYVFTDSGAFTGATDYVACYEQYVFEEGSDDGFSTGDCDSSTVFRTRTGSQNLGEDALKDETGYSRWLGVSFDLSENLQVTLDYSELFLEDRVETESTSGLLRDEFACYQGTLTGDRCEYVANRIQRMVDETTGISYISEFNVTPINQSEERIKSLDATVRYTHDTDFGDFVFSAQYSHMLSQEIKQNAGDEAVDIRDDEFLGGWNPRSVLTGTLGYNYDRFYAALTGYRIGSTTKWNPNLRQRDEYYRVAPYINWNLTAGYEVTSNLDVTLTVNNLFNQGAPKDNTFQFYDDPWYNIYIYSGAAIGREVFMNATYTF